MKINHLRIKFLIMESNFSYRESFPHRNKIDDSR